MNTFTDYYAVLGIDASASQTEIKAAFKKLARQYHPDVYKGADANERMGQILLAYRTLNDSEERRRYDAQRSEHISSPLSSTSARRSASGTVSGKPGVHAQHDVSPGARRDRQRRYAFPDFSPEKPVTVDLVDYSYELTAGEAWQLVRGGLLRGIAAEAKNQQYYCHRCHHHWSAPHGRGSNGTLWPRLCPRCHSIDWPEFLLLRCMHCSAIFESEQIRYEIGAYSYGPKGQRRQGELCPPYELFPLCPYCSSSHWCPAEDTRVEELRRRAAIRMGLKGLVGIGLLVIFLVLVGLFFMGALH